jgi:hypothetical protein
VIRGGSTCKQQAHQHIKGAIMRQLDQKFGDCFATTDKPDESEGRMDPGGGGGEKEDQAA